MPDLLVDACESPVARAPQVSKIVRRTRRVLLIAPPCFTHNSRYDMTPDAPLGIGYIAASLEQGGYEVGCLDALIEGWYTEIHTKGEEILVGLPYEEIERRIRAFDPDVVGVSSMFTCRRRNAHHVAQIVKKINPRIVTVFGGAHPTAAPEMVLEDPAVDFVVLAEGDNTVIPLLTAIEEGGDLTKVDGIAYRDAEDRPVIQPKRVFVSDLDTIPFPARHLLPMERYFEASIRGRYYRIGSRSTTLISSRGCQYLCNFCTAFKVFTRVPRLRSIENVIAELRHLVDDYGVDEVFFTDDQLIAKQRNTEALFDRMAKEFDNLRFDTPNGVSPWLLNERIIGKMKQAGCTRVRVAMESGNQHVLDDIINKPVKVEKIPGIVRMIRDAGMEVGLFIIVGNIGWKEVETLDQIGESFRMARKLRLRPHVSYLTPYPGSEVLKIAQEKGYLDPAFSWDDNTIWKQQINTHEWSKEQLRDYVERQQAITLLWYLATHPWEALQMAGKSLLRNGPLHIAGRIRQIVSDLRRDDIGRYRYHPEPISH